MTTVLALASALPEPGQAELGGAGEQVLFWVLAPLMVLAALGLLFVRSAVHAALCMAFVMVGLGIVYLAQQAPFLGVVQVFVYTGAVMMLFLFVLMLVGVDASDSLVETIRGQRFAATVFGLAIAGLLVFVLGGVVYGEPAGLGDVDSAGNLTSVAVLMFGTYVWAFEVTSALLITAALGAMMLAHRERLTPKPTQRELSIRRIREGAVKAPLPAPGVFARHNAVDTPALLPDGSPSELSVSRVLRARGQERSVTAVSDDVATVQAEIDDPLSGVPHPDEAATTPEVRGAAEGSPGASGGDSPDARGPVR